MSTVCSRTRKHSSNVSSESTSIRLSLFQCSKSTVGNTRRNDVVPWPLTHTLLNSEKYHMPIATIPILNSKMYAITDPILVQSAYCNKNLSFTPLAVRGAQRVAGFDDAYHKVLMETNVLPEYFKSIYDGTTAHHIHRLNVTSLKHVSKHINSIGGDGMNAANTYLWLRNLMTVATCEALFGPDNPIRSDELVEDVW
jgi:hypothetical protein